MSNEWRSHELRNDNLSSLGKVEKTAGFPVARPTLSTIYERFMYAVNRLRPKIFARSLV
jgi:hypothetical protein